MKICNLEKCTGCGACVAICSKDAIRLKEDIYGSMLPAIDNDICVQCGRCKNVCPNNVPRNFKLPLHTYAGWSLNELSHANAASGGIASEIYEYALENNIAVSGTNFKRETGVCFQPVISKDDIRWSRDSKYVYSNMGEIFEYYEEKLKQNQRCVFIGLPCQVAGLKNYISLKRLSDKNIVFIELICHGVPNWKYLDAHLERIEKKKKRKVDRITFRDPLYIYFFKALSTNGKVLYKAGMHEGDEYYRAFALNLIFRENCYSCLYAQKERTADITLGDFSGLGREIAFNYINKKISVVLGVTEKGDYFLKEMVKSGRIKLIERDYEEAYMADGNQNLRHPSVPHKNRDLFLVEYRKQEDFDSSVQVALKSELECWRKIRFQVIVKRKILELIPRRIKNILKSVMGIGEHR